MFRKLTAIIVSIEVTLAATLATGQSYQYTIIQHPEANDTVVNGINNAGIMVGLLSDNLNVVDTLQSDATGFMYDGQTWTEIKPPGAITAEAVGINNQGVIVGNYTFEQGLATYTHGFVFSNGMYQDIVTPFADDAIIADIADDGTIVGTYSEDFGLGFDLATTGFRASRNPNGTYSFQSVAFLEPVEIFDRTLLSGRNSAGQEVGTYVDNEQSASFGFLLPDRALSTYPSAASTSLKDINNNGLIAGAARMNAPNNEFYTLGFLVEAAALIAGGDIAYLDLQIPGTGAYGVDPFGGPQPTGHRSVQGLNDAGLVVGFFDNDDGVFRGFVGTPVEQADADYDDNRVIDGHDFLLWQRTLGASVTAGAGADGSQNGVIDAADLALWRDQYGDAPGVTAIPEPRTRLLWGAGLTALALNARGFARRRLSAAVTGC